MDKFRIQLSSKLYHIEFEKVKKKYSFKDNSQYITYIRFINSINIPVLVIESSELEFYSAIQTLDYLNMSMGMEYGDVVYFTASSKAEYYMTVNIKDTYNTIPSDDDPTELLLYINIIEKTIYGQRDILYTEISYDDLTEIVYGMYRVIEDVPYLDTLQFEFIRDFMEGQ